VVSLRMADGGEASFHYPGYFWSATMGGHVIYESHLAASNAQLSGPPTPSRCSTPGKTPGRAAHLNLQQLLIPQVLEEPASLSRSRVLMDLTANGQVLTGTWTEETNPAGYYQGAVYRCLQLLLEPTGRKMTGKWVGFVWRTRPASPSILFCLASPQLRLIDGTVS
jgi:hypothetical protein